MRDEAPDAIRSPDAPLRLARRIRAARRQGGLTLTELAAAARIDKGYLSRVERGLKVPSVATVLNIARALGLPASHLFGETVNGDAIRVSRGSERPTSSETDGSGYRLEALTVGGKEVGAGLEAFLIRPPDGFTDDFRAEHDGEELLFVVGGEVEVRFSDRIIALGEGDALQFPGHLEHQVRRTSPGATVLIVITRA